MTGEATAICAALEAVLRARAPGIHASTPMVRQLSVRVAKQLACDAHSVTLADLGSQVRDIGMASLPDSVVFAPGRLSSEDWDRLSEHPVAGSELLAELPGLEGLAPVVRSHHERWDGLGYPDGIAGEAIPPASRIIAVCDAFVAIASDRPHRRGAGAEAAMERLRAERGRQFEPKVVDGLLDVLGKQACASRQTAPLKPRTRTASDAPRRPDGARSLAAAIDELDPIAAFAPARDRLLAAIAKPDAELSSSVVSMIESDLALTVTVLREAQPDGGRRSITNVPDAVAALSALGLRQAVGEIPTASFPWRTQIEANMHHARVHAQAVARAADHLARASMPHRRDDLLAAALLHDVGKLVLARAGHVAPGPGDFTPEERVGAERRAYGTDHATLGSLLARRWGLPACLAASVGAHHSSEDQDELATLVRLADMVAHQAHGSPVDRRAMLRLADAAGISVADLRDMLFDLPHTAGSQRRRSTPSPLTERETVVLRLLGEGHLYKQIAQSLMVSASTVRSHLNHIYKKLDVPDRAQAVLRAHEMAWI